MHEILRDLEGFGKLLALLREAGVNTIQTTDLKLVFNDEEEDEEEISTMGFAVDMPDTHDDDEPEAKNQVGFDTRRVDRYAKLNLVEMK